MLDAISFPQVSLSLRYKKIKFKIRAIMTLIEQWMWMNCAGVDAKLRVI